MAKSKAVGTVRGFAGNTISGIDFTHTKVRIDVGDDTEQWIDIEIRHGRVMIRGGRPVVIRPEVSNVFYVELAEILTHTPQPQRRYLT